VNQFQQRFLHSQKVLTQALQSRGEELDQTPWQSFDFAESEQALLLGHSFHPTPKSRESFTDQDTEQYSAEFAARFHLVWLQADTAIVHQQSAEKFQQGDWSHGLYQWDQGRDLEVFEESPCSSVMIPMHPWQWSVLQAHPVIQKYVRVGQIRFLKKSHYKWLATSSTRTLYHPQAPYMLKFSLSVRLTNSLRHLLPKEVERGLQLYDVMRTRPMREFQQRFPNFTALCEPTYLCLKDPEGIPIPATVVVGRDPLPAVSEDSQRVLLATLTQDPLLAGESLLEKVVKGSVQNNESLKQAAQRWFAGYLQHVVTPLLVAQADYGVLLGAHQQNLILQLKNGQPSGAIFRDCQGTGYSTLGFRNFSSEVKAILKDNENVVSEEMGNSLFSYYLFVNSTFNVATTLARLPGVEELDLIDQLREALHALLRRGVRDDSCLRYLLESDQLLSKGNYLCSITGLNENTTDNPLDLYQPMQNPLRSSNLEERLCQRV
jgi:N2-citryl-N6-acetyl-N6-hydroxylysine synthase